MTLDNEDYKINLDSATNRYTRFIVPECNISAKNGVIHTVNGLLPVFVPKPLRVRFETTDYPDLKQQNCYWTGYQRWYDGQHSFEKIKFYGEYLLYYYNSSGSHLRGCLENRDCLVMSGSGWIEITTPKITKGNWEIQGNIWNGDFEFPVFEVYVDDKLINTIDARIRIGTNHCTIVLGSVNWKKSEEHKIRLVNIFPGKLLWDNVELYPVSE